MSVYQWLLKNIPNFVDPGTGFQIGFNWSPMYTRSTGVVKEVSSDLRHVVVEIPLTWRNANYVGSIFGGALLSATDPILMIQLLHLLEHQYIVWDKAVTMKFKRPGRSTVRAEFLWTISELEEIKEKVQAQGEIEWQKQIQIKTVQTNEVVAELTKTLYIATKEHYQQKQAAKKMKQQLRSRL